MAASLSVLVPTAISDGNLVSSNVPENEYVLWDPNATYAVGVRCRRAGTHRIFESQRAGNVGKDPALEVNQAAPAPWWLDLTPTNRYAMFDGEVNTQTEVDQQLRVVLKPGAVTGIFGGGLDAELLSIIVTSPPGGEEVGRYQASLEDSAPDDWFEHFYEPYRPVTDFLVTGLEPYLSCQVEFVLSRASGVVKCGILSVGDLRPLGDTQFGATAEPKSYSYVKTDEFGKTKIKRRKSAQDMTASAILPIAEANGVLRTLNLVMGVPCVWIGTNLPNYSGLRSFGLGVGKLTYENSKEVNLTLTVQGMI